MEAVFIIAVVQLLDPFRLVPIILIAAKARARATALVSGVAISVVVALIMNSINSGSQNWELMSVAAAGLSGLLISWPVFEIARVVRASTAKAPT